MNPPKTRVDPQSETFQQQRGAMLALIEQLRALEGRAVAASAASKPAFDKRSALLPRERLAQLLDPGAPFLELASLAGYCTDDADPRAAFPAPRCSPASASSPACAAWWSRTIRA